MERHEGAQGCCALEPIAMVSPQTRWQASASVTHPSYAVTLAPFVEDASERHPHPSQR